MKRTLISALALAAGLSAQAQLSAWLPKEGQFVVTPGFTYSTFDEFWLGSDKIDNPPNGKELEQYSSYVSLEYGITPKVAADLTMGYTWTETDAFGGAGSRDDRGLADTYVGVRYQFWNEREHEGCLLPTMAVRIGGVIHGTYDENFPFSAGDGANGLEGSLLLAREICPGFGAFGDIGYRFRDDEVPNDFFASGGFYAGFAGFNATVAYRHVQSTSGPDIGDPGFTFPELKEISQNVEFGLGYTDPGDRHYQVFYAHTLDGRNTGKKDIFGFSVSFPFGGN